MRIIHLASFDGNIGDNASHLGFNSLLKSILSVDFSVERLEIRKFYNNYSLGDKRFFNEDFADQVNKYDLLVVGGGGFLDFDIKDSVTGTTFNITPEVLDRIKVPIFISSIGSNPRNEIPEGNVNKFKNFLNHLLNRKNAFLAVRNDGSIDAINEYVGADYANAIPQVLDHGFFYENNGTYYNPSEKPYILINTTDDQLKMVGKVPEYSDTDLYVNEMRMIIDHVLQETDLNIVFAPHIFSDIAAISSLLKKVNDFHIRTRIAITPYVQGDYGCNQVFSAYKNSKLVIGMRFHANVCSMAMKVPSLAIAALDRVNKVYEDMNLAAQVYSVHTPFSGGLVNSIKNLDHLTFQTTNDNTLFNRKEEMITMYKDKFNELLDI